MVHTEPTREQGPSVDGPLQLDFRGGEVEKKNTESCNLKDDVQVLKSFKLRSNVFAYYPPPSPSLMGLV